ncbi:glutathione S-transferase family protein [Oecophyllibacter saccharovorans]|uniref:glutathione S-transferase family protein n=1 Tax=Oecophyllibacter saccharovorans TaxID=2558360 RepID=UPI0011445C62|nr:glutathione S-transferase family protein [Oecophyllibacter saccharovorans]QDH15826.1 glutathione S-transferase family protein [Oecophyllibacter saccharovorans]
MENSTSRVFEDFPGQYHLISAPGTAGLTPHIILQMSGQPYQLTLLNLRAGEQKTPAYLRLNPNGRVPTLILPDETKIFEAAAITMVLARAFPELGLCPDLPDDRALYDQWLVFLTNTFQANYMLFRHPERLVGENTATQVAVAQGAAKRCEACLQILAKALEQKGPYLLGEKLSAADLYLAMICRWAARLPQPPRAFPALAALLDRINALPAVREVLLQEQIEGPLA